MQLWYSIMVHGLLYYFTICVDQHSLFFAFATCLCSVSCGCCLLHDNLNCCLVLLPMCMPHLFICICLNSSPIAYPPSIEMSWDVMFTITSFICCFQFCHLLLVFPFFFAYDGTSHIPFSVYIGFLCIFVKCLCNSRGAVHIIYG